MSSSRDVVAQNSQSAVSPGPCVSSLFTLFTAMAHDYVVTGGEIDAKLLPELAGQIVVVAPTGAKGIVGFVQASIAPSADAQRIAEAREVARVMAKVILGDDRMVTAERTPVPAIPQAQDVATPLPPLQSKPADTRGAEPTSRAVVVESARYETPVGKITVEERPAKKKAIKKAKTSTAVDCKTKMAKPKEKKLAEAAKTKPAKPGTKGAAKTVVRKASREATAQTVKALKKSKTVSRAKKTKLATGKIAKKKTPAKRQQAHRPR